MVSSGLNIHFSFLTDGVRVHIVKHEKPLGNGDTARQDTNTPWNAKEEVLKQAEPVAESGKLFVRNLWYSVTEELLQELFQKYGELPHDVFKIEIFLHISILAVNLCYRRYFNTIF